MVRVPFCASRKAKAIGSCGGGNMTAAEFETLDEGEAERLFQRRLCELLRAGYACAEALTLTVHLEVDLQRAIGLPQRGCPHTTAVRILL